MKGKFLVLAVTLSLTGAASTPVWAANTGGTADSPATGDYAGKVVTGAAGAADKQSVVIDSSVTGNVYGGYISNSGNTDSVSGNCITVTADIDNLLYGGYTKGTGGANDNIIKVNGDVKFISGGQTNGNNADNNKIYITGGTVTGSVTGGKSGTSSTPGSQANNNEIYITAIDKAISINNSGNSHVIGGSARKTAAGNKIFIGSDNDQYDIEMGQNGAIGGMSREATNNQVTVGSANGSNNIKLKFVYGAWVTGAYEGDYGEGNSVLIQNDKVAIVHNVDGAFGNGPKASLRKNSVIIKDGTFAETCWITGARGEGSNTEITGNHVDISGGTFTNNALVFGGLVLKSYTGATDGNAKVIGNSVRVSGVTMSAASGKTSGIYGGYSQGNGNLEKNEVIIEEENGKSTAINVMISGAVNESAGAAELKENKVIINGGTINAAVFGAYTEGTGAAIGNSVTISGGTLNK